MNVLVDTPIWSLAFRRKPKGPAEEDALFTQQLTELIEEGRAEIIGSIRQEVLSGLRDQAQFLRLRERLRLFEDALLATQDYEEAARIHNQCRAAGVAGSAVDFLICAAALRRKWQIFTLDKDFEKYARHAGIVLFVPRTSRR